MVGAFVITVRQCLLMISLPHPPLACVWIHDCTHTLPSHGFVLQCPHSYLLACKLIFAPFVHLLMVPSLSTLLRMCVQFIF